MLKVLSLFSGIGAQEEALNNLNINYELVNYCEIDKYASKSFSLIHNIPESKNLGDITKIEIEKLDKNIDLIFHGSPCQDFSVAGLKLGGDENSKTRSSLMWNTVEIIKQIKPKYVIWENVKGVLSPKHKPQLDKYLKILNELGYTSNYKILNSSYFNIPQARERLFVVSVLDSEKEFIFPKGKLTDLRVKDFIIPNSNRKPIKETLKEYNFEKYFIRKESKKGLIKLFDGVKQGYRYTDFTGNRIYSIEGMAPTFTTKNDTVFCEINGHLNTREKFKLQGFKDYTDLLLNNGIPKGQIHKQIGNSITVTILEEIFKNLLGD